MSERFFKPGEYASIPKTLLADTKIGMAAKLVYLGLQSYLAGCKTTAWPGPSEIGKKTGLSRRGIQMGVDELVAAGWIEKHSGGGPVGKNGFPTNLYTLHPRRTACASAQGALPLAQTVRGPSAPSAPKEHQRRTPEKNPITPPPVGGTEVPKAPRVPDPIWDSICCSFGLNPVTKSERTRVGGITRDLKLKGASPDDIATRITTYRRQWPKMTCTPEALLKHWDSLGSSDNGATEQDPLALHNGRVLAQEAQERKNA